MKKTYRCYTCKKNKGAEHFYLVRGKVSQSECRICASIRRSTNYRKDPESFRAKRLAYAKAHPKETAQYHRNWRLALKLEVITKYGGICSCPGCGQSTIEFLSIEHPNGGGRADRLEHGKHGSAFYAYIRRMGFPKKYKLLCFNCNCSLGFYGYCPHVTTDPEKRRSSILPKGIVGKRKNSKYVRDNRVPIIKQGDPIPVNLKLKTLRRYVRRNF